MPDSIEIKNSVIRTLLGSISIPVLGPALTEFFEFRGKLKQNRLNQFIELLENYFSNNAGINLKSFQTVEFGDLFESVLKRVVLTQSTEKMRMFKDIIVNQIECPSQSVTDSEIYLDLISELSETEIKILFEYRQVIKKFQPEVTELNDLEHKLSLLENKVDQSSATYNSELLTLQSDVGKKRESLNALQNVYQHDHFGISIDQFLFCKQRLFSKALLVDNGIGSIDGRPFMTMGITQFGIQFIDYIMASS
jgi:hypothetical protein